MEIVRIAHHHFKGLGRVWIAASDLGIRRLQLGGERDALERALGKDVIVQRDPQVVRDLSEPLSKMGHGKKAIFQTRLDLRGTPFQMQVWQAIAAIPWGETRSYAWLARTVRRPRAIRAAANACGVNPIPIIIPCHRVIASDGRIGGFSGGLALKERLLALEGITIPSTASTISHRP